MEPRYSLTRGWSNFSGLMRDSSIIISTRSSMVRGVGLPTGGGPAGTRTGSGCALGCTIGARRVASCCSCSGVMLSGAGSCCGSGAGLWRGLRLRCRVLRRQLRDEPLYQVPGLCALGCHLVFLPRHTYPKRPQANLKPPRSDVKPEIAHWVDMDELHTSPPVCCELPPGNSSTSQIPHAIRLVIIAVNGLVQALLAGIFVP